MTRSTAQRDIVERDPNRMRGSIWWQGQYIPIDMPDIPHAAASAGRLFSTADDLSKWMLVHLSQGRMNGNQIIAPTTLEGLHTMNTAKIGESDQDYTSTGYALGWHTATFRGEPMLGQAAITCG